MNRIRMLLSLSAVVAIVLTALVLRNTSKKSSKDVAIASGLIEKNGVIYRYYIGLYITEKGYAVEKTCASINRAVFICENTNDDRSWLGQVTIGGPGTSDLKEIPLSVGQFGNIYQVKFRQSPRLVGRVPDFKDLEVVGKWSADELGALIATRVFSGVELVTDES